MQRVTNGSIGVGLLGAGVVGGEVARAILRPSSQQLERARLSLRHVLVRDIGVTRDGIPPGMVTNDPEEVLGDQESAIVIETMGGEEPARSFIASALSAGKHVVTANKEVLAKHGDELTRTAQENGVELSYEASVGGGIPVLAVLNDSLGGNRIDTIRAIINGTTNYILTSMDDTGASFNDSLAEAQRLGFAESDPTADVGGYDAVYKLAILTRLAWGESFAPDTIHREGIEGIEAKDLRYARELGFRIKLLAIATEEGGGLRCRVHPALVPADVPMASVHGVMNAVEFNGDRVGPLWLQGRGAGSGPTASAVLGDVLRIARRLKAIGSLPKVNPAAEKAAKSKDALSMDDLKVRYYVRLSALDRSGVLAKIATVFGDTRISIASVIQKDLDGTRGVADLVVMTHPARERDMRVAASQLRDLYVVSSLDNLIRVEDYEHLPGS